MDAQKMSRRFKIETCLSDADFQKFRDLLLNRRTVLDDAMEWLRRRGYKKICRGAVGNYRRHLHDVALFPLRRFGVRSDADARRKIAVLTKRMSGASLGNLLSYAAYLAHIDDAACVEAPSAFAGGLAMRPDNNRSKGVSKGH